MKRRPKNLPKYKNPYKLENELCDVLAQYARDRGWSVFPETSNFDILLVKDGFQIGIQAKLKDNINVLAQIIDSFIGYKNYGDFAWTNPAPDLNAVLVPRASREFHKVARALKIHVIHGASIKWDYFTGGGEWVKVIDELTNLDNYDKSFLTNSKKKCWVPEVEINVPAGVRSPKLVTPWKIKAVKLCLKLRSVGYLTSKDFKEAKVSMTLWKDKRWLLDSGEKEEKLTKYVVNKKTVLPDELYPEITEAIKKSITI